MTRVRLTVDAGTLDRPAPLVSVRIPAPVTGPGGVVALRAEAGGQPTPGQYDPASGMLTFVAEGGLRAGERRTWTADTVTPGAGPAVAAPAAAGLPAELAAPGGASAGPRTSQPDQPAHPPRYAASATVGLDRVGLLVAGRPFATYLVAGARRPYFWPVLGPAGASLVRGQGSGDHPHHTGLAIAYGGHSEGGSVNIWSDWDEPPYGPGGRMLHRGFRRVAGGPVSGELVQDLTYVDAAGEPFAAEVRTVRWWWASPQLRFLDLGCEVSRLRDRGTRPFLTAVRTSPALGLPASGRVTSSAGKAARPPYRAGWVDASGPTGPPPPAPPPGPPEELPDLRARQAAPGTVGTGPWNGIALLDHPANAGYPNLVGRFATAQQLVQAHYPPPTAPGGPFTFRQRVVVHAGDADQARLADLAADYAEPAQVTVEPVADGD